MARQQGGDLYDFDDLTDDELRQIVLEHLAESPSLDLDDIDVVVLDGTVTLSGRVGTDAEVQVAEEVLDDVLGLETYVNELVVDELRRGDAPPAADEEITRDAEATDPLGGKPSQQSDTADHLVEDPQTDAHGTHDMGRAIRDGASYQPPDGPIGDGYGSREDH